MKQIYFIITLVSTLTIGIISLTSGITFAQNETSEIEDSPLITTPELEESVKADNNTSSYGNDNNETMIEKIFLYYKHLLNLVKIDNIDRGAIIRVYCRYTISLYFFIIRNLL